MRPYQILTAGGKAVGPGCYKLMTALDVCRRATALIRARGRRLRVAVHGPDKARLTCYPGEEAQEAAAVSEAVGLLAAAVAL